MKVYVAEGYAAGALAQLKSNRQITVLPEVEGCEALLIRSQTKVDQALLDRLPDLKIVVTATSGFDHIDWQACKKRKIVVSHTPTANADSTAELTMFLMMAMLRHTLSQIQNARGGKWREDIKRGEALSGRTLGIIGLGRVGSRVARLASAFGMKVVGHDPYVMPHVFEDGKIERMGLVEVLRMSEIVTLHVPLTKETKHLINQATLQEMATSSYLVNCCRGAILDESEVLVALRENRLLGIALDVLEKEPPNVGNELLRHPRAIVTPHVGAFTRQAFENASMAAVERLIQFTKGTEVEDTLPLPTPWFEKLI
jgi:D-3-phosphoglycerate dehydrogenase